MKNVRWISVAVLIIAGAFSIVAFAKYAKYDFGLNQKWSQCDGQATYNVILVWTPVAGAYDFAVASGNACKLRGQVCGTGAKCGTHTCPKTGVCEMGLSGCQQGRGAPWVRIADNAGRYQQVATEAPRACR